MSSTPQTGIKRLKRIKKQLANQTATKDGRRAPITIGDLNGVRIAIILRSSDQWFRGGASGLTNAIENGSLCWMIDTTMLPILQDVYGVKYLGTLERETGTLYMSEIEAWMDPERVFVPDPMIMRQTYRRAAITYLPIAHMRESPASEDLIVRSRRARKSVNRDKPNIDTER